MKLHPVAALLPPLDDGERAALRASIEEHGVLDPVVVDGRKQIVDGRHRAELAAELGVELPTRPLPDGVSPWAYGLTANLDRRHLTAERRAAVVLLAERAGQAPEIVEIRERATENQQAGEPLRQTTQRSSEAIGGLVGVSGSTVERVERAARTKPEALDEIATGKTTASTVVRAARPVPARDETRPDPMLELPCPSCGRWTPQWVLTKTKPPEGVTWRWLTLRGSGKTRNGRSRAAA